MKHPCPDRQEQIEGFVTGTLSPETTSSLQEHIHQCPACREYLEALSGDSERLAQFAEAELLASIPLSAEVTELADRGRPITLERNHPIAALYRALAEKVENVVGK